MDWTIDRIESAFSGKNPAVICRMKSGFVVLADTQFLPGYCILLACPKVKSLNDLGDVPRLLFLREMAIVGDAIMEVCQPLRINYEILSNTDSISMHISSRGTTGRTTSCENCRCGCIRRNTEQARSTSSARKSTAS
jgi:diadenosine tetraphosphate (Ap4A) HIT family hydrolase